jgi:hypothetical protein
MAILAFINLAIHPFHRVVLNLLRPRSRLCATFFDLSVLPSTFSDLMIRSFPRVCLQPRSRPSLTFLNVVIHRILSISSSLFLHLHWPSPNRFDIPEPSDSNESLDLCHLAGALFQKGTVAHEKVAADGLSGASFRWMSRSVGVRIKRISMKKFDWTKERDANDVKSWEEKDFIFCQNFVDQRAPVNSSQWCK